MSVTTTPTRPPYPVRLQSLSERNQSTLFQRRRLHPHEHDNQHLGGINETGAPIGAYQTEPNVPGFPPVQNGPRFVN